LRKNAADSVQAGPPGRRATPDATVRVGPLIRVPDALRELGIDPDPILRSAGFDPAQFDDPDVMASYVAASRLLAGCKSATGCEHFGLLVGKRAGPSEIGIAGFVLRCAPDVATALRNLERYLELHDRGAAPTFLTTGISASLGYAIHQPGAEATEVIYDIAISCACNLMRSLCGADWNPVEVLLARSAPRDTAPYARFFRAPVRFDSERSELVFAAKWLEQPVPTADPMLHRHLAGEAERMLAAARQQPTRALRVLLRRMLLEGRCSCAAAARQIGVHPRTLNRQLLREGTTFQRERDEVRDAVAKQLLSATSIRQEAIAAALGYSGASAFNRAFKRRTGTTPAQWRDQNRDSGQT
jgi:AraC-like DNA-binding protein